MQHAVSKCLRKLYFYVARISHFVIARQPAHMVQMTLRANVGKSMLPRCPRQDRVARMRAITSGLRSNAYKAHAIEPFAQRLASEPYVQAGGQIAILK